jgi:hypothetical protein
MKRSFLLVAVVLLTSARSPSARAQYGFPGSGNPRDPLSQIGPAKSAAKQRQQSHTKTLPRARRGVSSLPRLSQPGALDRFGRQDLSGRPVPGYPVIRGDVNNPSTSRGGANGAGGRSGRRQ